MRSLLVGLPVVNYFEDYGRPHTYRNFGKEGGCILHIPQFSGESGEGGENGLSATNRLCRIEGLFSWA